MGDESDRERDNEMFDHPLTRTRTRRAVGQTWQAREGEKVWQKALFEQASRLVRLHEGIVALERQSESVLIRFDAASRESDPLVGEVVPVPVPRVRLLELLRALEGDVMQDMARILRQVTQ